MKKLTGTQSAEILFDWYAAHNQQLNCGEMSDIENLDAWLTEASELALHLASHPYADLSVWPWQTRCLLAVQVANWMGIASSAQCAEQSLPIEPQYLGDKDLILGWLFRNQIAPMSVFDIPRN